MSLKNLKIALLSIIFIVGISSCNEEDKSPNSPNTSVIDSVTSTTITYESSGGYTFINTETNAINNYTHQYVKINYKDQSHIWTNTQYTYFSFYNLSAQAAAEMITFVLLGKDMPKTGTYKLGPWPISSAGITENDKLLSDEMAIMVVGNSLVSKRDATKTINVVNNNGQISITSSNEIEVYSNLMGNLKGKCNNINLTRTTKKV